MASTGGSSGRAGILSRVLRLARGRRAEGVPARARGAEHERRIGVLEERVDQLEGLIEGLQDAVHRQSVRDHERIAALEKKSEPAEISRALSRDARERGL